MFELLQQNIKSSRERSEVCKRVQRQLSLPPNTHVHVREEDSGASIQMVITVIESKSIHKYWIAKASADISDEDIRRLLNGWPGMSGVRGCPPIRYLVRSSPKIVRSPLLRSYRNHFHHTEGI
jgi:hypothetical protein